MTVWLLRVAAFCLGIAIALPTHAEKRCWRDSREVWVCAQDARMNQEELLREYERQHPHPGPPIPLHREDRR